MNARNRKRTRQLFVVLLVVGLLVLTGTLVVYADSPSAPARAPHLETTPEVVTPTPSQVSNGSAEPAIMDDVVTPSPGAESSPATALPTPMSYSPASSNLIVNGGFEEGFAEGVGVGWGRFATANVQAGWQDDTWPPVVYEGEHSQLLSLKDAVEMNRYAGIFQTVQIQPETEYLLSLHGLIRSDEGSIQESDYGYRIQYGLDFNGGSNWQSPDVTWFEMTWDEQPLQQIPAPDGYQMGAYTATITAKNETLTIFIAGWKKWIGAGEGDYNLDGISLVRLDQAAAEQPVTASPTIIPAPSPATPAPAATVEPQDTPIMPQTGDGVQINYTLLIINVVLLVVLAGGVIWTLTRRRA